MKSFHKYLYFGLLQHAIGSLAARGGHCPPLGPVLPAPVHPSTHPSVEAAVAALQQNLESTTASYNGSGLAVGVKSIHEKKLMLEFAYTPPTLDPRGKESVDSDTVFRLASLSKVFPVLAILKLNKVSLDDAVTKFLPQLRALNKQARAQNSVWTVDWDDVTVGALASHLGGFGADMITDIQPYGDWTQFGFPGEDVTRNLNCSGLMGVPACKESVFWERFGERPPVYAPFAPNTVYSNIGWVLIGKIIEKVSGMPSEEFIQKFIWDPTGMKHTFSAKPEDDSVGFIPLDDEWWNATLGFVAPAGDYYSTINDLHAFGDAVLRHKLLSPAHTRKWMKPTTSTSSQGILIGAGWEIFRSNNVTKDGRLIEFYTKGGDISTYHSLLVLIPDYDLVFTILGAGPEIDGLVLQLIFSDLISVLLPSVEEAGKEESSKTYGGTYSDQETNSTLTLSVDDEPGFSITNWTVRGVDIINTYLGVNLKPILPIPTGLVRFRLYPTNLEAENQSSWRFMPVAGTPEETEEQNSLFAWPDAVCNTWASLDRIVYQLLSQDHFVFTECEGEGGRMATELELVGYRVTLKRQE
ncbi:hypothetical protein FZEAL_3360 [Fusarium zealandicum]|uniref:Beta-lactamase-related domain-containing protein n=1 Tax=Fusarium zealandicum TaxID=1053134 RepID=A0A8H4UNU4_9HYPO|nr:hypothetical protein FZEAL_3360 [Fusarium zealandicum]